MRCIIKQSWSRYGPNYHSISLVRWSDKLYPLCETPFLPLWLAPGFIQPLPSPSLRLLRKSSLVLWGALFQWSRSPKRGTLENIFIFFKHDNYTFILMAQNYPNNVLYIESPISFLSAILSSSAQEAMLLCNVLCIIPKKQSVYIHILDTHKEMHRLTSM